MAELERQKGLEHFAATAVMDTITKYFASDGRIAFVALFGSFARRKETVESDVDLVMGFVDRLSNISLTQFEIDLSRQLNRTVEIIDADAAAPLLRFEIARDGILIVERVANSWANFRTRALVDWWDWEPTFRVLHRRIGEQIRSKAQYG